MNFGIYVNRAVSLIFIVSVSAISTARDFSELKDAGNGHVVVASVTTDKGHIRGFVPKNALCTPYIQLLIQAEYAIETPVVYEHFQDNLQALVTESVATFNRICNAKNPQQTITTIQLARVTQIDKKGNIQGALQRMGSVTANGNWLTKHTQLKQSKANREAKQKTRRDIAKVRQYNHQQALAAAIYTPKFDVKGPFTGLAGDKYLNAIYQGNFAVVKRADQNYADSYKKLYALATNNNPGLLGNIVSQALGSLNIHASVSAKYLFHYEKRFNKCLKPDAETFAVKEKVPDIVGTNMLGVEMWRMHGFTNTYKYKVNKEFAHVFRQVGTINPNAFTFVNMLLSSGYADYRMQVVKGVEQIQSQYACDDPVVTQFEQNLQKLYAN